jgi:hypothetical protein
MLKVVRIYQVENWELKYAATFTDTGLKVGVSKPVGIGEIRFVLQFSESMNTDITPIVTFGLEEPYTQHKVSQYGAGWAKTEYAFDTWYGKATILAEDVEDYIGINTLRVSAWDYTDYTGEYRLDTKFDRLFLA